MCVCTNVSLSLSLTHSLSPLSLSLSLSVCVYAGPLGRSKEIRREILELLSLTYDARGEVSMCVCVCVCVCVCLNPPCTHDLMF